MKEIKKINMCTSCETVSAGARCRALLKIGKKETQKKNLD